MRLVVEGLGFSYPGSPAILSEVGFQIESGESLCLLGPNGAGKSTLLMCLVKALKPDSGSISIDGEPIAHMSPRDFARRVAYVPQTSIVQYDFTMRDWVVMGRAPHLGQLQHPGAADYALVDEILADLRVDHLGERSVLKLSGGERQQAALARALVQEPQLLILDEPTSALDFGNQQQTLRIIERLLERQFAVIMTTHAPNQALRLGGSVALVGADRRFLSGETSEILTSETLTELYGTPIELGRIEGTNHRVCVPV